MIALRVALVLLAGVALAAERRLDPGDVAYTYAPAPFTPEYEPPAPGTYELPVIDTVGDHPLVDVGGTATSLSAVTGGRVAVVAFVYTTCTEAAGCPLSMAVLERVDRALAEDPALRARVTLVAISFDPERDTPARMAVVRRFHTPRGDWRFLTTRNEAELAPLLADFDQPVAKLRWADGTWTGTFRHVLKVFLLDGDRNVRNVYSAGFLHPQLVVNDVRTVLGR